MADTVFEFLSQQVPISDYDLPEEHDEYWDDIEKTLASYIISGNDLNTEETRFVTVLRLYTLISESAEEYRAAGKDVQEINIDSPEAVQRALAQNAGRYAVGNTMAVIYSMGYELIDALLEDLLAEIVQEEYATEEGVSYFQDQFDKFEQRSVLLMKMEVIEERTHKLNHEISDIRQKLVHDPETRFHLPMIDDLEDVENIIYAVNALYERVHGAPAYEFVEPEASKSSN